MALLDSNDSAVAQESPIVPLVDDTAPYSGLGLAEAYLLAQKVLRDWDGNLLHFLIQFFTDPSGNTEIVVIEVSNV